MEPIKHLITHVLIVVLTDNTMEHNVLQNAQLDNISMQLQEFVLAHQHLIGMVKVALVVSQEKFGMLLQNLVNAQGL
jgi:hypothetical protein